MSFKKKKMYVCVGFERKHKNESENKSTEVQGLCASRTYTSLRTSWDHYNALLRHCHPALVNLCQGHTHTVHTHPICILIATSLAHSQTPSVTFLQIENSDTHMHRIYIYQRTQLHLNYRCAQTMNYTNARTHTQCENLLSERVHNEARIVQHHTNTQVQSQSCMI